MRRAWNGMLSSASFSLRACCLPSFRLCFVSMIFHSSISMRLNDVSPSALSLGADAAKDTATLHGRTGNVLHLSRPPPNQDEQNNAALLPGTTALSSSTAHARN